MGKWVITVTNLVEGLLEGAVNTRFVLFKDPTGNPTKEAVSIKLGNRCRRQHFLDGLSKGVDV